MFQLESTPAKERLWGLVVVEGRPSRRRAAPVRCTMSVATLAAARPGFNRAHELVRGAAVTLDAGHRAVEAGVIGSHGTPAVEGL